MFYTLFKLISTYERIIEKMNTSLIFKQLKKHSCLIANENWIDKNKHFSLDLGNACVIAKIQILSEINHYVSVFNRI